MKVEGRQGQPATATCPPTPPPSPQPPPPTHLVVAGAAPRQHRALCRLHRHQLHPRLLLLQVATCPGDRAARAHPRHQKVDMPLGVPPNLGARGLVVNLGVGCTGGGWVGGAGGGGSSGGGRRGRMPVSQGGTPEPPPLLDHHSPKHHTPPPRPPAPCPIPPHPPGFSNCCSMYAPGVVRTISSAFSIAPVMPRRPLVSTSCAPKARSSTRRSMDIDSGIVSTSL